ncbi:MAG TPA: molybdopterin oxidoreductase family protein [Chloroflexia bacterium]|nr:molybdopterin oxidoreductase family protein [Chloroflexia bacterium]
MTIAPNKEQATGNIETKKVICPHDCPDTCCMSVTVKDGRIIKVTGEESHPFTQGFLCIKTNYYLERLYSPLRIKYPMKRVGPKGSGQFERISWDEALDTIASRYKEIAAEYGPEAILPYSYAGTMGLLSYASMDRRFFHYLGASLLDRTICSTAGKAGYVYTMGASMGTDPESIINAKLIICWGTNPVTTNVHLMPFINEAKKRGAMLVTVDPHRSKTAEQSDLHIQPYPGTDAALALGMMNVIISEGLHDKEFIEKNTVGFELLAERAAEYPLEKVEKITGIPAEQVRDFARLYATTRPSFIRLSYGMNRHTNGGMMVRTVTCLPALIGAWDEVGGGALLSSGGSFPTNKTALERPDFLERHERFPRTINMIKLGEALLEYQNPPVKALFVYNSNPAAVAPNSRKVIPGLQREDLFTVVHEQVMTDTARYADIVLPAPTTFECLDLHTAYGHLYVQLSQPAIAPLGEVLPNTEVFRRLAQKMGFDDPAFSDSDEELIRQALTSEHPAMQGITYERLQKETFIRLNVPTPFQPFADGKYPTPSGKIELYSESMLRAGLDPLPTHNPSAESADGSPELFEKYPVRLITPAAHHFLNSSFADMPTMIRKQQRPYLELNEVDARERGIQQGQWVRAWNDRGEAYFVADIKNTVAAGVACHLSVWWQRYSPLGWNCNALTSDAEADMGGGATFHTNLVQVELASLSLSPEKLREVETRYPLSEEVRLS